jgi:hypothetical protein
MTVKVRFAGTLEVRLGARSGREDPRVAGQVVG